MAHPAARRGRGRECRQPVALVLAFLAGCFSVGALWRLQEGSGSRAVALQSAAGAAAAGASSCPVCPKRPACPACPKQQPCPELAQEQKQQEPDPEEQPEPEVGSYQPARHTDYALTSRASTAAFQSPLRRCVATQAPLPAATASTLKYSELNLKPGQTLEWWDFSSMPCAKEMQTADGCCHHVPLSFRSNSSDEVVKHMIFRDHFMKMLYAWYEGSSPEYILDAGANVGISATLFKLLWPNATVVSLEPDPGNFAGLKRNTQRLEGVHAVQAGLWGWKTNVKVQPGGPDTDDAWKFVEVGPGEDGIPALSIKDVQEMFNIPYFDFVKIDIEGSEGMVFSEKADRSWVEQAKVVVAEPHDRFHTFFNLGPQEMTRRIYLAFEKSGHVSALDGEHIYFIAPEIVKQFNALHPAG